MTHPNIDLIRRYSEALTAGKAADALPFYTEDLALHIPGRSPHAGTFRGQDAVLAYYTRLFRDTDGAFTPLGVDDILASEDHAASLVRWRVERNGRSIEIDRETPAPDAGALASPDFGPFLRSLDHAMAKSSAEPPGRSGSQFYVVTAPDAGLPPEYALVGKVSKGYDVVEKIDALGTPEEKPKQTVLIEEMTIDQG